MLVGSEVIYRDAEVSVDAPLDGTESDGEAGFGEDANGNVSGKRARSRRVADVGFEIAGAAQDKDG